MRRLFLLLLISIPIFAQFPAASLQPLPKWQPLDNNGRTVPGGKICTYQTGTFSAAATYTNNTGNVQLPNPIILDSAGRAAPFFSEGSLYRVVLQQPGNNFCPGTGAVIWTQDQVGDSAGILKQELAATSSTPGNNGAALIGFEQSGTSTPQTVQAKLQEQISVLDYGADPSGMKSSYAAFQAAATALAGSESGELYIPPGTYLLPTTWKIENLQGGKVHCAGWDATLQWTGGTSGPVVWIDGDFATKFSDCRILVGSANPITAGSAVVVSSGSGGDHSSSRNILDHLFVDCTGGYCNNGLAVEPHGQADANNDFMTVSNTTVADATNFAYWVAGAESYGNRFVSDFLLSTLGNSSAVCGIAATQSSGSVGGFGANFAWEGGTLSSGASGADFCILGSNAEPFSIKHPLDESNGIMLYDPAAGQVSIEDARWSKDPGSTDSRTKFIDMTGGILKVANSFAQNNQTSRIVTLSFTPSGGQINSVELEEDHFITDTSHNTWATFIAGFNPVTANQGVLTARNVWWETPVPSIGQFDNVSIYGAMETSGCGTNTPPTVAVNSATIDVSQGGCFRTLNTMDTTITTISPSPGMAGKQVSLIIGDSHTSIDDSVDFSFPSCMSPMTLLQGAVVKMETINNGGEWVITNCKDIQ